MLINRNRNNMFFIKIALFLTLCLLIFGMISNVNAKSFNNSTSSSEIQEFLNKIGSDETELIFEEGDYTNKFFNLNVSKSITIKSNGQVNIRSTTSGYLFNITAPKVQIINLNISGYQTAIKSTSSKLSLIGNNISTAGASIDYIGSGSVDILLENNNIISFTKSYQVGAVTINTISGSTVNVTMIGNNITANGDGTYSTGVFYGDSSNWASQIPSNVRLNFENNNIKGAGYASFCIISVYNKNNITLTNNNISGTGREFDYAGHISITGGVSTLTLTRNDIKGISATALKIEGNSGNNTLIFKNNNFTATGLNNDGLYFNTMAIYNNMTFIDNFIKAESGYCVYLVGDKYYSSPDKNYNFLTFINNNITGLGKDRYGVLLSAKSSNNNITVSKNTIYGSYRGFDLSVKDSNNNITISYNNITGATIVGFNLHICDSKNDIISVVGNNFSSDLYAMNIYSAGKTGGVSIVNNTFNSKTIGLNFELLAGLTNINITGNTIFADKEGIGFRDGLIVSVGISANYNRILAPIGLNFTRAINGGSNFDFNWWGINNMTNKIIGFETNNHYILNITNLSSLKDIRIGDKVNFALLVVNSTMTIEGVENLPYFIIHGYFNGVEFFSTKDSLFIHEFIILIDGIEHIDDLLDDEHVLFDFDALAYLNIVEETPDTDENSTNENNPNTNETDHEDSNNNDDSKNLIIDSKITTETDDDDTEVFENKAKAAMKNTGIPIAIILITVVLSLVFLGRKK